MAARTGHITESALVETGVGALVTLAEAARARRFFDALRSQGKRPATVGAYESDWRRFARWYRDANGEPFDITRTVAREVAEFRSQCLRAGQAPATVNRRLVFIAEYARWAAERGDLAETAAEDVARVAKVRQQPLAPRGLNKRELRRLLKEVDLRAGARDRALMYLLLFTGLRLGEVASLRREDIAISARKGTVRVRGDNAKGGKERLVPIPPAARTALSEYVSETPSDAGPVFEGQRGALGRGGVAKVVGTYARAAGAKVTPHTLRHCFAYRYLERSGNDLVGLAAILGHSNLNTTMGYTRKRLEDLEAAMEEMEY